MTRNLLDTGIASDFLFRRQGVYERAKQKLKSSGKLGIGMLVLAELIFGFEKSDS